MAGSRVRATRRRQAQEKARRVRAERMKAAKTAPKAAPRTQAAGKTAARSGRSMLASRAGLARSGLVGAILGLALAQDSRQREVDRGEARTTNSSRSRRGGNRGTRTAPTTSPGSAPSRGRREAAPAATPRPSRSSPTPTPRPSRAAPATRSRSTASRETQGGADLWNQLSRKGFSPQQIKNMTLAERREKAR